ncbi:MAG TPA: hypothetical protein VGK29_04820 [Paludibaculum sp.]
MLVVPATLFLYVLVYAWTAQSKLLNGSVAFPCPLSALYLLPALAGAGPALIAAIPTAIFCYWCNGYFYGLLISPRRSTTWFTVVALGSLVLYGSAFTDRVPDPEMLPSALLSLACAITISTVLLSRRQTTSLPLNLLNNFLLFAWTFTSALPMSTYGFDL